MTESVVFRVDASTVIGTGHVMRCLTLATRLKADGAHVSFICRAATGDLVRTIAAAGIPLDTLNARTPPAGGTLHPEALNEAWPDDAEQSASAIAARHGRADWIVVDHYALDARWETHLRNIATNVMVIDDLANRRHDCEVLVDQNLHANLDRRYDDLIPPNCRRLLGPRYALLRPEFRHARERSRTRGGSVRRVLVFFGGVDMHNETSKTLEAVKSLQSHRIAVDVIVGAASPHLEAVRAHCAGLDATVHHHPSNIAELAARADLAIGATGATSWERCCVGLPSIVISLAPNQESVARALWAQGLAVYLGRREAVSACDIAAALDAFLRDPAKVRAMSAACAEQVDGRGVDRVARALDAMPIALRLAEPRDCNAVYEWRNAEETRRYTHDNATIALAAHTEWFTRTLADASRVLLIAECEGEPVGVLRYDCAGQQSTVSIYLVPGHHGGGYGPRMLSAGHAWLRLQRPEVRSIRAEVLPGNRASAAAFLQCGYRDEGRVYIKDLR